MQVKIQSAARELKPLRGAPPNSPLYTGIKVDGQWYNIEGDHRSLYNKVVDLEFNGNIARFATLQHPPAAPQSPPPPPPPSTNGHGHTPRWPNRESVVDAYIYYATQVSKYLSDPIAIARATNCLVMLESQGEVNPVHREPGEDAS